MRQIAIGGVLPAPAVALGCMRLASLDECGANRLIRTALDCGVTCFDHADIYGRGEAERLFGRVLRKQPSLRDGMVIATKCGIRPGRYDFSKQHILASVDESLRRMGCGQIDLLLLHRPDALMEPEEVAEAFSLLRESGKVRYFGVSNQNPLQMELLSRALDMPLIADQLQLSIAACGMIDAGFHVNMGDSLAPVRDGGVLEYCRLKHITIQAWSPLQYGFFEGCFLGDARYPALNEALARIADARGAAPAAIAAAWILRIPGPTQVIAGTVDCGHLRSIAAAGDITLTREEWYELYRAAGKELP